MPALRLDAAKARNAHACDLSHSQFRHAISGPDQGRRQSFAIGDGTALFPDAGGQERGPGGSCPIHRPYTRSEEHTSELQSLMRISYAVFCLKQKKKSLKKTNIRRLVDSSRKITKYISHPTQTHTTKNGQ